MVEQRRLKVTLETETDQMGNFKHSDLKKPVDEIETRGQILKCKIRFSLQKGVYGITWRLNRSAMGISMAQGVLRSRTSYVD